MGRLAGDGAGGGRLLPRSTADCDEETAVEAPLVGVVVLPLLLLLLLFVLVTAVDVVEDDDAAEDDGLLLFLWLALAVAADVLLLLASADVSPDPLLPLTGASSCCDGGVWKRKRQQQHEITCVRPNESVGKRRERIKRRGDDHKKTQSIRLCVSLREHTDR